MKKVTLFLSTIALATLASGASFAEESAAKTMANWIKERSSEVAQAAAQPAYRSEACYILGAYGAVSSFQRSMVASSNDTKLIEVVDQFNLSYNRLAGFCGLNSLADAVAKDDLAGLNAEIATLTKYMDAVP